MIGRQYLKTESFTDLIEFGKEFLDEMSQSLNRLRDIHMTLDSIDDTGISINKNLYRIANALEAMDKGDGGLGSIDDKLYHIAEALEQIDRVQR